MATTLNLDEHDTIFAYYLAIVPPLASGGGSKTGCFYLMVEQLRSKAVTCVRLRLVLSTKQINHHHTDWPALFVPFDLKRLFWSGLLVFQDTIQVRSWLTRLWWIGVNYWWGLWRKRISWNVHSVSLFLSPTTNFGLSAQKTAPDIPFGQQWLWFQNKIDIFGMFWSHMFYSIY